MLKLLLVRHGETEWNREKRIQGAGSDIPLSDVGLRQAELVSQALRLESITAVYASPLRRARITAETIARPHGLTITEVPAFKEIDAGDLEGHKVSETPGMTLSSILVRDGNGAMPRLPGGESLAELQARAWPPLQQIITSTPEGVVVVASHYFTILTMVCSALGFPIDTVARLTIGTGSITTIRFTPGSAVLLSLGDTCHLERGTA